jgi:hypothetical protein
VKRRTHHFAFSLPTCVNVHLHRLDDAIIFGRVLTQSHTCMPKFFWPELIGVTCRSAPRTLGRSAGSHGWYARNSYDAGVSSSIISRKWVTGISFLRPNTTPELACLPPPFFHAQRPPRQRLRSNALAAEAPLSPSGRQNRYWN